MHWAPKAAIWAVVLGLTLFSTPFTLLTIVPLFIAMFISTLFTRSFGALNAQSEVEFGVYVIIILWAIVGVALMIFGLRIKRAESDTAQMIFGITVHCFGIALLIWRGLYVASGAGWH